MIASNGAFELSFSDFDCAVAVKSVEELEANRSVAETSRPPPELEAED